MKKYKLTNEDKELIEKAKEIIIKSAPVGLVNVGDVGSALMTSRGNIFQGVCMDFFSGIGSCGEYQAIGSMVSNGESKIKKIAAVWYDEKTKKYQVIPPCGKCREMIKQLDKKNWNAEVIISSNEKVKLKDLLPYSWGGTIEKK
jgi:cytidine deaminase